MRQHLRQAALLVAVLSAICIHGPAASAQDDIVKGQKERAEAHWKRLFEGQEFQHLESTSFLFYGPKSLPDGKFKALGESLEQQFGLLRKALSVEGKKPLFTGKLTVYLFDDKREFASFIRGVEKRRPEPGDLGSLFVRGEQTHLAICGPATKEDPSLEAQAAQQLQSAVFNRALGEGPGTPEWLFHGLIHATNWRMASTDLAKKLRDADRKKVLALITYKKRTAKDLFTNTLMGDDLVLMRASVTDYLAYGPGAEQFPVFIRAFKPEEGRPKSIDDALAAVKLFQDKLDRAWASWVRTGSK